MVLPVPARARCIQMMHKSLSIFTGKFPECSSLNEKLSSPAPEAMKAMKSMKKAMKVSIIAKGKRAKASVFKGSKVKTSGGLKKTDLIKSKSGKIVSKKASLAAKKKFTKGIGKWSVAVSKARKALGIKGFVPVGGKTAKGQAFLKKAKSFYK